MNIQQLLTENAEFHRRASVTLDTVGDVKGGAESCQRSQDCYEAAEQYARELASRLVVRQGLILDETFSSDHEGYYRLGEFAKIRIEGLRAAFAEIYGDDKVSPIKVDGTVVSFRVTT